MSYTNSVIALGTALASVSISQLIFKARFMRLGALTNNSSDLSGLISSAIADGYIWLGGIFLIVGVCCWYYAMIRLPLNLMLPMAALLAPIVSFAAFLLFGENLTPAKFSAIAIIGAGAAWLGWLNA